MYLLGVDGGLSEEDLPLGDVCEYVSGRGLGVLNVPFPGSKSAPSLLEELRVFKVMLYVHHPTWCAALTPLPKGPSHTPQNSTRSKLTTHSEFPIAP